MDKTNGIFEMAGGLLLCINIYKLRRDKSLAGVSVLPTIHFTMWGVWNLWYYPSLGQTWSFWGAVCIVSANTVWVIMAIWYIVKKWLKQRQAGKYRAQIIDEWHLNKPEEPDLRTFNDINNGGVLIGEDVTFQDMSHEPNPPNNEVDMCFAYGKPCEDVSRIECDAVSVDDCPSDNAGTVFAKKTKADLKQAKIDLEEPKEPEIDYRMERA